MDQQVRTLYTMHDNRMYCKTTDNEIYYMPIDVWESLYEKDTCRNSLGNQLFKKNMHWTVCDDTCQFPYTDIRSVNI